MTLQFDHKRLVNGLKCNPYFAENEVALELFDESPPDKSWFSSYDITFEDGAWDSEPQGNGVVQTTVMR